MVEAISRSKDRPSDPRNREVVFPAARDPQRGTWKLQLIIRASSSGTLMPYPPIVRV
jgi:hypothetical protein